MAIFLFSFTFVPFCSVIPLSSAPSDLLNMHRSTSMYAGINAQQKNRLPTIWCIPFMLVLHSFSSEVSCVRSKLGTFRTSCTPAHLQPIFVSVQFSFRFVHFNLNTLFPRIKAPDAFDIKSHRLVLLYTDSVTLFYYTFTPYTVAVAQWNAKRCAVYLFQFHPAHCFISSQF